jgi:hypothetical protein
MRFLLLSLTLAGSLAAQPFDILLRNGQVIDGAGSPWYAAIGRLADAPARQTIDARGMVVAPGFIDMLGQSEITAEGGSAAPLNDAIRTADRATWRHYVTPDWSAFRPVFRAAGKARDRHQRGRLRGRWATTIAPRRPPGWSA